MILVLGSQGQVGWELQRSLAPLDEITAWGRRDCDLGDPASLTEALRRLAPQVIVNAAAYTAVDQAESESQAAQAINIEAPRTLAAEAARLGAVLVHYSTDYVFDGSGERPWREDDTPAPLNAYGQTKLAGEEAIRASGCRHLILRTSWVYSARGRNFIRSILRLARNESRLRIVTDQIGAPTGADLLADITAHLIAQQASPTPPRGLFHVAANGEASWHAVALRVCRVARQAGWPAKPGGDDDIEAISSSDYPTPARRPANSRLDCSKLKQATGLRLPDWESGLDRTVVELSDQP